MSLYRTCTVVRSVSVVGTGPVQYSTLFSLSAEPVRYSTQFRALRSGVEEAIDYRACKVPSPILPEVTVTVFATLQGWVIYVDILSLLTGGEHFTTLAV